MALAVGRLVEDPPGLRLAPCEESVDDGFGLGPSGHEALLGWRGGDRALDAKQPADERQRLAGARSGSVSSAFHQYLRACAPARNLDHGAAPVQVIEHRVRVGDQVALVSLEQPVDGSAVMFGGVREQHVPLRRDDHPEMSAPRHRSRACASRPNW